MYFDKKTPNILIMKKLLILSLILTLNNCVFALDRNFFGYTNSPYQRAIMRPAYNPYSNSYKNPYLYKKNNLNNTKRIQRLNKIRQMNKLKNNLSNWNIFNNGSLTGYSVPITTNSYSQILDSQDLPSLNSNLYSSPSGFETYYSDGSYFKNFNDISGTTGVKIIYD